MKVELKDFQTISARAILDDMDEAREAAGRGKLLAVCDQVPFHRLVTVESESLDEERLAPEHAYFINTQLLGKDKLLTKGGDKKTFTFWQTVANTIAAASDDFVLIIDEAHRGAGGCRGHGVARGVCERGGVEEDAGCGVYVAEGCGVAGGGEEGCGAYNLEELTDEGERDA